MDKRDGTLTFNEAPRATRKGYPLPLLNQSEALQPTEQR